MFEPIPRDGLSVDELIFANTASASTSVTSMSVDEDSEPRHDYLRIPKQAGLSLTIQKYACCWIIRDIYRHANIFYETMIILSP
jgi:hypothetical protein